MRKNGFTLIELLAVIVILAIIALIATPIILGIINDAREESNERSVELYLSGVELSVARRNLTQEFNPSECTITEGVVNCVGYDDPLIVDVDGEKPVSGTILFANNKVAAGTTLTFDGFTATLNTDNKVEIGQATVVTPTPVCTYANEGTEGQPGSKYNCNVDGTNTFSFHILSVNGASTDLLLDNNICENGTLATNYSCNVKYSLDNMSETGPTTAMTHLYNATKNWSNIPKIESYTYNDNGYIDEYYNDYKYGYDSYEINSGVVQITDLQNSVVLTLGTNELPVRARIASLSDFTNHCSNTSYSEYSGCASWLFNGLDPANTVNGYWLLNASNGASEIAPRYVASYSYLKIGYHYIDNPTDIGVRPVITIPTGLLG